MLPSQFKKLTELMRTMIDAAREANNAAKNQETAIRRTSETANEQRREIPLVISAAIRAAHEDVPVYEKIQREKEYAQQRGMRRAAWLTAVATTLAFVAAGIYAYLAKGQLGQMSGQLVTMNRTYQEIQRQTKAAQLSEYMSCLNAQAAQATFIQSQNTARDSHTMAAASVQQAAAEIESQRAFIEFVPRLPLRGETGNELAMPFFFKNDGKSTAFDFTIWYKALLVRQSETLSIGKNLKVGGWIKYLPAGAESPSKSEGMNSAKISITIQDVEGRVVLDSSQEAQELRDGTAMIAVFGHMRYSDFAGTHKVKFCDPFWFMKMGTERVGATPNESTCNRYNGGDDEYTGRQKVETPMAIDPTPPIKCVAPN